MSDDRGGNAPLPAIPLLIFHPLTPSVELALPFVFTGDVPYQMSVHELTVESLDIAEEHAPAIALFSVLDEDIRERLRLMMRTRQEERKERGLPKDDPLLRIVLVSEERKGLVLDRWQELGAHEVMLAPILSRPLVGKLERHFRKLIEVDRQQQKDAEREGRAEERAKERARRLKAAREKAAEKPKFVVHGKALGPNTFLFPSKDSDDTTSDENVIPHRVVVSIEVDASVMPPGEGTWVKNPQYPVDDDGEGAWDWVVTNVAAIGDGYAKDDFDKKAVKYRFFGQKPVYDQGKKAWIFMGKNPKLYGPFKKGAEDDDADTSATLSRGSGKKTSDLEKPETLAFCASKGNGVFFFKNQVEAKKTEVLFYTEEQWKKSPMASLEKKAGPEEREWNNKINDFEEKDFWRDKRAPLDEKAGMRDRRTPDDDEDGGAKAKGSLGGKKEETKGSSEKRGAKAEEAGGAKKRDAKTADTKDPAEKGHPSKADTKGPAEKSAPAKSDAPGPHEKHAPKAAETKGPHEKRTPQKEADTGLIGTHAPKKEAETGLISTQTPEKTSGGKDSRAHEEEDLDSALMRALKEARRGGK